VHGFTSGADAKNVAVQWGALTSSLLVFFLVMLRVFSPRRGSAKARIIQRPQRNERPMRSRSREDIACRYASLAPDSDEPAPTR
jgi:hypothetical protein